MVVDKVDDNLNNVVANSDDANDNETLQEKLYYVFAIEIDPNEDVDKSLDMHVKDDEKVEDFDVVHNWDEVIENNVLNEIDND